MRTIFTALAVIATAFAGAGAGFADGRKPNPDEQAAIEGSLRSAGYTAWSKVELDDDGYWDVDDAVGPDGKKYDVDLAVADLKIVKTEIDND